MTELKAYIAQGEHDQQDFKFSIEEQKKIARTLCAFANTKGGRLLIGVKDNGKIAGCNPDEEFHMIQGAAEMYVQPPVPFEHRVHQEKHLLVLEIKISASNLKQYMAFDEEGEWKPYWRLNDQTMQANKIIRKVWKLQQSANARPEVIEEEGLGILRCIQENPLTLSKIYRVSQVDMRKVDHWLSLFISWGLVKYFLQDTNLVYQSAE